MLIAWPGGRTTGGSIDIVARSVAQRWSAQLGQPIVIDNRGGANGIIGMEVLARAPADGYTVLLASPSSISVNPALNPKLGYRFSDLQPVAKVTTSPLVIGDLTLLGSAVRVSSFAGSRSETP